MGEKFYTPKEVAEMLEVTERAVFKWLNEGKMKGYKFGGSWKIKKEDFDEFVQRSSNQPKKEESAS